MHSLPISALGHCHLSVSVCLCRVFFSPIWPLDDETAAPVFWHELSLHIRPLWWRLSAWHARICPWLINPHTHMCTCSLTHSNTHITSGSPTTSRLFLSYTRTRCPTQLSITAPEKVGWTNLCSPQRDSVLADTSDRPKKKKKGHAHKHMHLLYKHNYNYLLSPSAFQIQRSGRHLYTSTVYICLHTDSITHAWALFPSLLLLIWYMAQSWIQLDWSYVCSPANGR